MEGYKDIYNVGVSTIAGGKTLRNGGHVDGPSEDAKFSNDFDVVYVGSSCSLLVIDRGNKAIREIQLHFDDCAYQYGSGFPLGIAVLVAAGFFGYMLALLQQRVGSIVSSHTDQEMFESNPGQKYMKPSTPSLIPTGDEQQEKEEESFMVSFGKLISNAWDSVMEIVRKKQTATSFQQYHGSTKQSTAFNTTTPWPIQDSFVIRDEDEPPPIEPRNPTPRKMYAFMSQDAEKMQQLRPGRAFYSSWDAEFPNKQQQQQKQNPKQQHRRHSSSIPHTYIEQDSEKTNEVVFGAVPEQSSKRVAKSKPKESGEAVQEQSSKRVGKHKPTQSGEQMTNTQQNLHYRAHSVSYPYGYYPPYT